MDILTKLPSLDFQSLSKQDHNRLHLELSEATITHHSTSHLTTDYMLAAVDPTPLNNSRNNKEFVAQRGNKIKSLM